MPRVAKELSALEVKRLSESGFHAVGKVTGLGLMISPTGSKSWVLRVTYGNERRKMGLGSYPSITLAAALEKAREIKDGIQKGIDPIQEKKNSKSKLIAERAKSKTFVECAELYLKGQTFSNVKHGKQWKTTLETYAYPYIGSMLVNEIGIANIREVLDPIWNIKPETASRVQGRIKTVIDFAIVNEYREKINPAIWKGYLDTIYKAPKKIKPVKNMDSLPYSKVYDFLQALRTHNCFSAKALEFLILTGVRSGSVRTATWSQIDMANKVWTVPKAFTKTKKRDHTVPLSSQALELLNNLERIKGCDLIFPSPELKVFSDVAISKLMLDMRKNKEFEGAGVPHGFRTSFSTWRLEKTNYSQELGELCIMHSVGDAVYQAYQRSDGLFKRRAIMQDWANFINKPYVSADEEKILPFKRSA